MRLLVFRNISYQLLSTSIYGMRLWHFRQVCSTNRPLLFSTLLLSVMQLTILAGLKSHRTVWRYTSLMRDTWLETFLPQLLTFESLSWREKCIFKEMEPLSSLLWSHELLKFLFGRGTVNFCKARVIFRAGPLPDDSYYRIGYEEICWEPGVGLGSFTSE